MRTLDLLCGNEITSTIAKAIAEAKAFSDQCQFEFNGVNVIVAADSNPELIYRDWSRAMSGYLGKNATIGPYPAWLLSPQTLASDAAVREENERREEERQEKYAAEAAEKSSMLKSELAKAGPIELYDEAGWQSFAGNNKDPYGSRVVRYAEEWARLMQSRMASGQTIPECANETSQLANDDGITGFMYGCAVGVLSKVWKHGESLRRWHNKETQIGTEGDRANESGGVLNPAMFSIG